MAFTAYLLQKPNTTDKLPWPCYFNLVMVHRHFDDWPFLEDYIDRSTRLTWVTPNWNFHCLFRFTHSMPFRIRTIPLMVEHYHRNAYHATNCQKPDEA